MSIFAACFGNHSLQDGYGDRVFYSKAEITEDGELLFTPFNHEITMSP
jgi:hypothetical protein